MRPFLTFGPDIDSDAPAAKAALPAYTPSTLSKPRFEASLQVASSFKSWESLQRGRISHRKKRTLGAIPSAYFTGFAQSDTRPLPVYDFDSVPDNIEAPEWG